MLMKNKSVLNRSGVQQVLPAISVHNFLTALLVRCSLLCYYIFINTTLTVEKRLRLCNPTKASQGKPEKWMRLH